MANESAPNTRTLNIQWDAIVTRADETWRRNLYFIREFEDLRPDVYVDWRGRGVYGDTREFILTEDEQVILTEAGDAILME